MKFALMKSRAWTTIIALLLMLMGEAMTAQASETSELIAVRSKFPVAETIDRLQQHVTAAGFFVAARVDHAKGAASVGLALRPTELLVFGNPKGGTPLMQCDQRAGIDLPLRALAWQDEGGQVWLGMTNPNALKTRYDLAPACDKPIEAMEAVIRHLLDTTVAP
jgi:uncharacterized protein (DUF302 family)